MTADPHRRYTAEIVSAPAVARWGCPCCGHPVPRLLPNGAVNRHRQGLAERVLEHPRIQQLLRPDLAEAETVEVCLACRDATQELLGTLLVPEGLEGDLMGGAGIAGTRIIAAVLTGRGSEATLFVATVRRGALELAERLGLSEFNPARMTYPATRGEIDAPLWALYQEHLSRLRARAARGE
jgi:hypothetical protein